MNMRSVIAMLAALLLAGTAFAQNGQPQTPEQREKQMYENIQKQVDQMADNLNLEDWQIFYADSILTTNFGAMAREFESLSRNKVSDPEIYSRIQDECMEKNYNAFHKILDEKQWARYLKMGAAREKRARDKREEKRRAK